MSFAKRELISDPEQKDVKRDKKEHKPEQVAEAVWREAEQAMERFHDSGKAAAHSIAEKLGTEPDEQVVKELEGLNNEAATALKTLKNSLSRIARSVSESAQEAFDVIARSKKERMVHRAFEQNDRQVIREYLNSDFLPAELWCSEDMQRGIKRYVKREVLSELRNTYSSWNSEPFQLLHQAIEKSGLSNEEAFSGPEIQEAAIQKLQGLFERRTDVFGFNNIKQFLSDVSLARSSLEEIGFDLLVVELFKYAGNYTDNFSSWNSGGRSKFADAIKIAEIGKVDRDRILAGEGIKEVVKKAIVRQLDDNSIETVRNTKEFFKMSEKDPEALALFVELLDGYDPQNSANFLREFPFDEVQLQTVEVRAAIKRRILNSFNKNWWKDDVSSLEFIIENSGARDTYVHDPEIRKVVLERYVGVVVGKKDNEQLARLFDIKLDEPALQEEAIFRLKDWLKNPFEISQKEVREYLEDFQLPYDLLHKEDVKGLVLANIENLIKKNRYADAYEFVGLSFEKEVRYLALKAFHEQSKLHSGDIQQIIKDFGLSDEDLSSLESDEAFCEVYLDNLRSGKTVEIYDSIEKKIIRKFVQADKLLEAAKEGFLCAAKEKRPLDAMKLAKQFNLEIPDKISSDLLDVLLEQRWDTESLALFDHVESLQEKLRLIRRIALSPSQSLQRVRVELVRQLANQENALELLEEVEGVFVRNNLPEVGKLLKVFEILHTSNELERKLQKTDNLSPVLKSHKYRGRMMVLYRDMLRAHIDSNNRSLRSYLEIFDGMEPVLEKVDSEGEDALTPEEKSRFERFCAKLNTLFLNSQLGHAFLDTKSKVNSTATYEQLKQSLQVEQGQSVNARLVEMFLKPAGFGSVAEVFHRMDAARERADVRGRQLAERFQNGTFELVESDMLKGVERKFFARQLDGGVLCKEFLGSGADSDNTPLDTDLAQVGARGVFRTILENTAARGYGSGLTLLLRDRGQFVRTDLGQKESFKSKDIDPSNPRYELFATKYVGKEHMGIRTGFAATEIDAVIVDDVINADPKAQSGLLAEMAQAGWYIPVVSRDGTLLFTPHDFDEARKKFFAGVSELRGPAFELGTVRGEKGTAVHQENLRAMVALKEKEMISLKETTKVVQSIVSETLSELGVELHKDGDESLLGARLYDTGSSERGTNVPDSYDFDLMLKLDVTDEQKKSVIHDKLVQRFSAMGGKRHEADRDEQLRMLGIAFPDTNKPVDVDVGIASKHEIEVFESHDAVRSRLRTIRERSGESACNYVIANIVLAKKMLKEAKAYKKFEENNEGGGIGGIGVENWILSNGGDMLQACKTFAAAAYTQSGEQKPFAEFTKQYAILDPGINAKFGFHDNFILNMTKGGYERMAAATKKYCDTFVKE